MRKGAMASAFIALVLFVLFAATGQETILGGLMLATLLICISNIEK